MRPCRALAATVTLLTLSALVAIPACWAGGLRCSIGEVLVENLGIGQNHSLEELASVSLLITNTGDQSATVRVDPVVPAVGDLRYGAAPIPDVSWISAEADSFELSPAGTERVNLRIRIPDDPQWLGRKFQVAVWSHTLPRPGDFVACGLGSRVIFTVSPDRPEAGSTTVRGESVLLSPAEVTLRDVSSGTLHSLATVMDQPLVLKNPSAEKVVVELKMVPRQEAASDLPEGFGDLLAIARVAFSPPRVELQPGEEKVVSGTVQFLPGANFPAKTLVGVLAAQVIGQSVTTGIYARIYAPAP